MCRKSGGENKISKTESFVGETLHIMENSGSFKEKSLSNGVYFGEFKSKLFHGKGKYTWSNGTIYEGDWVHGKQTGKGRIIWRCGKKYKAELSGNHPDPLMGKNRSFYIGNWKKNKKDGRGIVKWANGDVLDGCWSNGLLRSGVYRFANGDVYSGGFKNSLLHGKGESACSNDGVIYEGDWVDGKMTGKGLLICPSGTNYETNFSNNCHGNGTYTWKDGSIYNGNWKNNKRDGKGIVKWANGDVFDGCWADGLRHGSGVYTFANGNVCIGNFKSNLLHGNGKYISSNGTVYKGYWDDGTMTEKIPDLKNLVGDCMLLQITNNGDSDTGLSCLVIKGENVQGVLIVEKIEQYSEITKLGVMQGKKSSTISTFFKTIKAKLERNLQL